MQFLVVNQECTANIFGHTYKLNPIDNPAAGLNDILVADDHSAFELLKKHREILATATFSREEIEGFPIPIGNLAEIPPGSKILILRSGGIGDHVMLTPALKAFRERLSDRGLTLWLSVQEDMFPIFDGLSYIDQLHPLPIPMSVFLQADYFADFSGSGTDAIRPNVHLTDYYMKCLGLDSTLHYNRMPFVSPHLNNSKTIIELFGRMKKAFPKHLFVLLNWFASTDIKSVPPSIFTTLTSKYPEIVFLVAHQESLSDKTAENLKENHIKAINISQHMRTFYDYFTTIYMSDAVICADTSMYHIASLYRKPSIVIIGPTYPILTRYYPQCHFINDSFKGKHCTSPCGRTKGTCPEAHERGTSYSPCLLSVPKDALHKKFRALL